MNDHSPSDLPEVENHLRDLRQACGLSQAELARKVGVTRQAIHAVETGQYLPATQISLRLAQSLGCRVEDLFSLRGRVIEGQLVEPVPRADSSPRVKVAKIGSHIRVMSLAALRSVFNFTVSGDGVVVGPTNAGGQVKVRLSRDWKAVEQQVFAAGCDPAILLAGEYLRRGSAQTSLVSCLIGSEAAIGALKRREVHMAGVHIRDSRSGEYNLPYIRSHLARHRFSVVRFASWEEGLIVGAGNPKNIRDIADLERADIQIVNREKGSGARQLLDQRLAAGGLAASCVTGYDREVSSHLDVAWMIQKGLADTGIGLRPAAHLAGLQFIPLQEEHYDLVIDKDSLETHVGLRAVLDTIVSRAFRTEIENLGGYDTRETGKILQDG